MDLPNSLALRSGFISLDINKISVGDKVTRAVMGAYLMSIQKYVANHCVFYFVKVAGVQVLFRKKTKHSVFEGLVYLLHAETFSFCE